MNKLSMSRLLPGNGHKNWQISAVTSFCVYQAKQLIALNNLFVNESINFIFCSLFRCKESHKNTIKLVENFNIKSPKHQCHQVIHIFQRDNLHVLCQRGQHVLHFGGVVAHAKRGVVVGFGHGQHLKNFTI